MISTAGAEHARFVVVTPAGGESKGLTALDLARAVAANPLWKNESPVAVVLKPATQAMIGVLGYFKASDIQLDALGWQLDSLLATLRYIDYQQAEIDAEQLASALLNRFGWDALQTFRFAAIPRGGYIVLGMLSYLLGLRRVQLLPAASSKPGTPLVVVDDCAITGLRFHEFLHQTNAETVVFAHLYSHPDLRRAIVEREPRVIACLSAEDLHDYAPEGLAGGYEQWRQEAAARWDGRRYWVGIPDHICFPWNEPDASIRNPSTGQLEHGWRILPPELCLKNRPLTGPQPIPVQIQPEGKGPLKPSVAALFGALDGELILGNIESGESFSLQGIAADMWQAFIEHGNVGDAAAALSQIYDVEEPRLREDVQVFASRLLAAGLLVDSAANAPAVPDEEG